MWPVCDDVMTPIDEHVTVMYLSKLCPTLLSRRRVGQGWEFECQTQRNQHPLPPAPWDIIPYVITKYYVPTPDKFHDVLCTLKYQYKLTQTRSAFNVANSCLSMYDP